MGEGWEGVVGGGERQASAGLPFHPPLVQGGMRDADNVLWGGGGEGGGRGGKCQMAPLPSSIDAVRDERDADGVLCVCVSEGGGGGGGQVSCGPPSFLDWCSEG